MAALETSILRVLDAQGETVGVGFVVSANLAVTCAHVVNDSGGAPGEALRVVFHATGEERQALVAQELWRSAEEEDVAFLRLEGELPERIQLVLMGASRGTNGHPFVTLGFPEANPEGGVHGDGHILGETHLGVEGITVLQLSSPQVTPGFSGAPVYDTVTERVIGMVTAIADPDRHGRLGETAFITPTETLWAICPELQLSDICPYRGLAAFTEGDARFFHGRTALIQRLVDSLKRQPRFMAVLGPSGSGKSSLVQAGLIPALRGGAILGSEGWEMLVTRPGAEPFYQLAELGLQGAEQDLVEAVKVWLQAHRDVSQLLLVLDQFEELLVDCPQEVQEQFIAELVCLLDAPVPIDMILVLRDDFYSRFTRQAKALLPWVDSGGLVNIPTELTEQELSEIIRKPAGIVGLQFAEGLVEEIIRDVQQASPTRSGRSAILPLLEFTLTQLWERRQEGMLTHGDYQVIGGVTGGLAQWADRTYYALDPGERALAQRILTSLVHLGDESQDLPDSRRRRRVKDLIRSPGEEEATLKVIKGLADARLVVTGSEGETVEIIHEAMLREWGLLQRWIRADRRFLAWRQELERRVQNWHESSEDEGDLLRGAALAEAEGWLEQRRTELGEDEQVYIQTALDVQQKEAATREAQQQHELLQARKLVRTQRQRAVVLLVGLVVAIILGILSFSLYRQSNSNLIDAQIANTQSAAYAGTADAAGAEAITNAGIAQANAAEAQRLADIALGRQAAAQSQLMPLDSGVHTIQSGLLAVEGLRHTPEWSADIAARRVLDVLGLPIAQSIHDGVVSAVAFSPDGSLAVSGGGDGIARVFDPSTGNEVSRMEHDDWVLSVAFNMNGDRVVSGSADGTARVWNAATGVEVARMVHEGGVNAVAFSPDGRWVVSGSDDRTARVWDASTGIEIARLLHEGVVYAVAFNPDGKWIVSGCLEGVIHVWEAATGSEISHMSLGYEVDAVYDVSFSRDGDWVVSGSLQGDVVVWEAATGIEIAHMYHDGEVYDVDFSPDKSLVVSGSIDSTARVWEINTGIEIARMTHAYGVNAVDFSPDGNWVVSGSWDGTARVWEATTGIEVARIAFETSVHAVSFDRSGQRVMTGGCDEGDPRDDCKRGIALVWQVATGAEVTHVVHGDVVRAVAFSPDGRWVVSGSDDGTARIWDVSTGIEMARMTHADWVDAVAFSPDGRWVVSGSQDGAVIVWDAATGEEISRVSHGYNIVDAVCFTRDGSRIISGSLDGTVIVWEAATGAEVTHITLENNLLGIAFNPDGRGVASESYDECDGNGNCLYGIARVFDTATGAEIAHIVQEKEIYALAFSPDGTWVASGSWDGTANLWEASSGIEVAHVVQDSIGSVAIDSDGHWITYGQGNIRVWNVTTGAEIARMAYDDLSVNVGFSPDGHRIVSGGWDGTVRVWAWQPADLIAELCRRLPRNFTQEEWGQFFGDTPYNRTCSNLPNQ